MVYSTRRFVLSLALCYFVLVFFQSFWHCDYLAWGRERANLSAFHTFVQLALVWFCLFPHPLHVGDGPWLLIVALPGPFSHLFHKLSTDGQVDYRALFESYTNSMSAFLRVVRFYLVGHLYRWFILSNYISHLYAEYQKNQPSCMYAGL